MLIQFIINGIITGILYSLSAIGFALIYNSLRIFHMAAVGIYVIAAYIFFLFYGLYDFPLWIAFFISLLCTPIISILCDLLVYFPLMKKQSSLNVIMVSSIGIMIILINIIEITFGNSTKIFEKNIESTYMWNDLILSHSQILIGSIGILTIGIFFLILRYSKTGLKLRGLSNDKELFQVLGFNTATFRKLLFGLSGIFLALASCLSAYDSGINPNMGMTILINAMVALIIGGSGRFSGCLLGGLILGVLQSIIVYSFSSDWQNGITFVLLILFLFLRPQGIIGYKKRVV